MRRLHAHYTIPQASYITRDYHHYRQVDKLSTQNNHIAFPLHVKGSRKKVLFPKHVSNIGDQNDWQYVEKYMAAHAADITFTHAHCPNSLKQMYPHRKHLNPSAHQSE